MIHNSILKIKCKQGPCKHHGIWVSVLFTETHRASKFLRNSTIVLMQWHRVQGCALFGTSGWKKPNTVLSQAIITISKSHTSVPVFLSKASGMDLPLRNLHLFRFTGLGVTSNWQVLGRKYPRKEAHPTPWHLKLLSSHEEKQETHILVHVASRGSILLKPFWRSEMKSLT